MATDKTSIDLTDKYKTIGQRRGKTIACSDDNVEEGEEEYKHWPEEFDPDEATELQREVVLAAVYHQQLDSNAIGELIGKKGGYVRATLRRCVPDWYDETFKPATEIDGESCNPILEDLALTCDDCGEQAIVHEPLDGEVKLRCRCKTIPVKALLPPAWLRDF